MRANVWLCGPPGAGKSTFAPVAARRLGLSARDVDAEVEAEIRTSIAAYVEANGIAAFRARESAAIARLAAGRGCVIALGAGALEDEGNRELIGASGTLVFLDTPLEACTARVATARGTRPLLREDGALASLFAERRPRYRTAAIRLDAGDASLDVLAQRLQLALDDERIVQVATRQPYEIAIGTRVLDALPGRAAPERGGLALIVCDVRVAPLAQRILRAYADAGIAGAIVPVTADEALKSLAGLGSLYDRFVAAGLDRRGVVVGVGGGTIADAVGFAAATYQRGVPYAGVPTTLLAAVDAAIGGKTAINLTAGKNLVGTTTQPVHVAIAPHALRTLDARDVLSGYGEMVKIGLALDAPLYRDLCEREATLLEDPGSALDLIARCVAHKATIVAQDEDDRTGLRALLNFGHTVGHALERVAGFGTLRHGEAVIVGMRAALALSAQRRLAAETSGEADAHLAALPVTPVWRGLDPDAVVAATANDKKRHSGGTRFVLLDALGCARLDDTVAPADVRDALVAIGLGA